MDPAFWQYCEIPLGIYGFSLNNNNKNKRKKVEKKKIPIVESLFTLVIKFAIQLCKNAFL